MLARTSMKASEFARLREQLGLNNSELALALGISRANAQRYEHNHAPINKTVANLLRMYATHGVPEGW